MNSDANHPPQLVVFYLLLAFEQFKNGSRLDRAYRRKNINSIESICFDAEFSVFANYIVEVRGCEGEDN